MQVHVIIAGSRSFNSYEILSAEMDKVLLSLKENNEITIITGAARGADALGSLYAMNNGYTLKEFPANWNKYGRSAGYVRNREMVDYVLSQDGKRMLVAFWDGRSAGTHNTITLARNNNIETVIVSALK